MAAGRTAARRGDPAPNLPRPARRSRPQRPGTTNQQPACPAALSIGQEEGRGVGGAARARWAGPSPDARGGAAGPGRPPLVRWTARPCRGRGVGGAESAGRAQPGAPLWSELLLRDHWATRRGTRVREPGTGHGIGSPDGAAQLQVDPGVGRGTGRICIGSPPGTPPPVSMRGGESSAEGSRGRLRGRERAPSPALYPPHSGKGHYHVCVARLGKNPWERAGGQGCLSPQARVWAGPPHSQSSGHH